MKKILILLCALLLCGCSNQKTDITQTLPLNLTALANAPIKDLADNNKPLYRYYIEPSIGRRESTQTSNVFVKEGQIFVMNLDIASVINTRFYDEKVYGQKADTNAMIALDGTYIDTNDLEFRYSLSVYLLDNGKYFIDLSMAYVNFYAYCEYATIESLVLEMMKIGKTVDVNSEKVIATYSSKQSTEYVKEKLDLFEMNIPDSGRIEELMGISPDDVFGDSYGEEEVKTGDEEEAENNNVHDVYGEDESPYEEE